MKSIYLFIVLFVAQLAFGQERAQKIGFIDSRIVMDELPETKDAKKKLEVLVEQWKDEVRKMTKELENKIREYQTKEILFTDEIKIEKKKDIDMMQKKIGDYQDLKFGPKGEYFKQQLDIMKPIQDRIYAAMKQLARDGGYDFIFDRESEILFLYANPEFDLTRKIIELLIGVTFKK